MTLQYRKRLFYALVAAFFVLGTGMILYVDGWRFDIATFRARKVGAIFIHSYPKDAAIYLDNKPVQNNSGFFEKGTLVGDLFPKTYAVKLQADGYYPWLEEVTVRPSLVSEIKYAVLVPKKSQIAATGTLRNFWLTDNEPIVEDKNGSLLFAASPVRTSQTAQANQKIGSGEIVGSTNDFASILTVDDAGTYMWRNIANLPTPPTQAGLSAQAGLLTQAGGEKININKILAKNGVHIGENAELFVDETDKRHLIVFSPNKISLLNPGTGKLILVRASKNAVTSFAASQFLFAWGEWNAPQNTSTIVIYDKFLEKASTNLSLSGRIAELRWEKNNTLAIRGDDGSLYLYNNSNNELKKNADGVKQFVLTKDGSQIAALEDNVLEVFVLSGEKEHHRFNLAKFPGAENIIWYGDKNHLFVIYPDEVRFLDLQDGAMSNFQRIANSRIARYDENENKLYFLTGNGLEAMEFPK